MRPCISSLPKRRYLSIANVAANPTADIVAKQTRFWKQIYLETEATNGESNETGKFQIHWIVKLDERIFKTVNGAVIKLPYKWLASMMASELDYMPNNKKIDQSSLPLTSIIMRGIDDFQADGTKREDCIRELESFAHTDSIW